MTLLPKDTVTVNKHNTAVCVRAEPSSIGDLSALFPEYVAVQNDAGDVAHNLLLVQKQRMFRSYLRITALIGGLALGGILTHMIVNQHFVVADYSHFAIFSVFVAVILPLCITCGGVTADGLEINDTVFHNLTAEDRRVLFLTHASGPDIYQAALAILTERYAAEEIARREDKLQKDQAAALIVLNSASTNTRK